MVLARDLQKRVLLTHVFKSALLRVMSVNSITLLWSVDKECGVPDYVLEWWLFWIDSSQKWLTFWMLFRRLVFLDVTGLYLLLKVTMFIPITLFLKGLSYRQFEGKQADYDCS